MAPSGTDKWVSPNGELLCAPTFAMPYIIVEESTQTLCVCEDCYKAARFAEMKADVAAEIYYQFALEYHELGRLADTIDALHLGLRLRQSANMLSTLALTYGELGEHELERQLYLQALALDPANIHLRSNARNESA